MVVLRSVCESSYVRLMSASKIQYHRVVKNATNHRSALSSFFLSVTQENLTSFYLLFHSLLETCFIKSICSYPTTPFR